MVGEGRFLIPGAGVGGGKRKIGHQPKPPHRKRRERVEGGLGCCLRPSCFLLLFTFSPPTFRLGGRNSTRRKDILSNTTIERSGTVESLSLLRSSSPPPQRAIGKGLGDEEGERGVSFSSPFSLSPSATTVQTHKVAEREGGREGGRGSYKQTPLTNNKFRPTKHIQYW